MADPALVALGNASIALNEVGVQMKHMQARIHDLEAELGEVLRDAPYIMTKRQNRIRALLTTNTSGGVKP